MRPAPPRRARVAVLASGGGSNLQALLDYLAGLGERRAADVVLVASDRAEAGALERARRAGALAIVVASPAHPARPPVGEALDPQAIDLVVLAGYLRLVPPEVTRCFAGRMLNVHPAPLPAFGGPGMYGVRAHRAVIAAGVPMSAATVHFVDEVYDHGAPIAVWPVPVHPTDDEHALAGRVLRAEHLLLPRVVQAVAAGTIRFGVTAPRVLSPFNPALDDASLGQQLDGVLAS